MPFYEYQCAACGHHHEELQKVTDRPLRKCPACGRATLKRLVSAPVFRLKGGGWYETDFKGDKENKRNLAGAEAEESSKTEAASETTKPSETETSKAEAPKPSKPEVVASSQGAPKPAAATGSG